MHLCSYPDFFVYLHHIKKKTKMKRVANKLKIENQ